MRGPNSNVNPKRGSGAEVQGHGGVLGRNTLKLESFLYTFIKKGLKAKDLNEMIQK